MDHRSPGILIANPHTIVALYLVLNRCDMSSCFVSHHHVLYFVCFIKNTKNLILSCLFFGAIMTLLTLFLSSRELEA
jgi:hypothetical protein